MNHNRLLVGLAGNPGTGKSTIATHLIAAHNFVAHEGSSILKFEAKTEGIDLKERHDYIRYFRKQQIKKANMAWLSDTLLQEPGDRLLQVGLRSKYDAKNFRKHGGIIVGLVCPPEQCLGRIDTTNPKNPRTIEEYEDHVATENSMDEYGAHTELVVAEADYLIDTSLPWEHSRKSIDEIVAAQIGKYAIL